MDPAEQTLQNSATATTVAMQKVVEKYDLPDEAYKCFMYHWNEEMERLQMEQSQ